MLVFTLLYIRWVVCNPTRSSLRVIVPLLIKTHFKFQHIIRIKYDQFYSLCNFSMDNVICRILFATEARIIHSCSINYMYLSSTCKHHSLILLIACDAHQLLHSIPCNMQPAPLSISRCARNEFTG